jgi:hypothetical protein
MMREGQIAGSACSSSILCLFMILEPSFRCCSLLLCPLPPKFIPVSLPSDCTVLPSSRNKDVFPFVRLHIPTDLEQRSVYVLEMRLSTCF